jgi:L-seryl-tRNA(Ser) seleniumtransferase
VPFGLTGEPGVREAVASGADAVVFSGDKLLGGPQAGILLGTTAAIAACRNDPVARAVRADKFTLAALEATLELYRDAETARREIPVLRMLTADPDELRARAQALAQALPAAYGARITEGRSEVGGGSFPGASLRTWLVRLAPPGTTASELAARLRAGDPPVIARIEADQVVLDPRTIQPAEADAVVRAARAALDG